MKTILIFSDWFIPGFKGGGPIRSCANFAEYMQSKYKIFILTRDRDFGDNLPYENIKTNEWVNFEKNINVFYVSPSRQQIFKIWMLIKQVNPDFVYLNTMFSIPYTLYPLLYSRVKKTNLKIILAPRGMLKESAIKYKSLKKKFFIRLLNGLGIFKNIRFHATDQQEAKDIEFWLNPHKDELYVLKNLPSSIQPLREEILKREGAVKIVYISRILPIKNLLFALNLLNNQAITGDIEFSIYGPVEDQEYWKECLTVMKNLPKNIKANYFEELEYKKVVKVIQQNHFFLLPTQGENFGHSIFESFLAGRPVIISDQTPWKQLAQKKIGWDNSLNEESAFIRSINYAAKMNQEEFNEWVISSWIFAKDYVNDIDVKKGYLQLFS